MLVPSVTSIRLKESDFIHPGGDYFTTSKELLIVIATESRHVNARAMLQENSRFFGTGLPESDQFHVSSPLGYCACKYFLYQPR